MKKILTAMLLASAMSFAPVAAWARNEPAESAPQKRTTTIITIITATSDTQEDVAWATKFLRRTCGRVTPLALGKMLKRGALRRRKDTAQRIGVSHTGSQNRPASSSSPKIGGRVLD